MRSILAGLLVLVFTVINAQDQSQTVRGKLFDNINRVPIQDAHVQLSGTEYATTSDNSGKFRFDEVPAGRYTLTIGHTSYNSVELRITVISGKETLLEIPLSIATVTLEEITIENRSGMLSSLEIGEISLGMEQTNRIPANFFDPVRMATSFPGVVAANDQANNLVIRGNSPNSIQWRLEGMTVVNPNHQTNAGTLADLPTQAGGGVNILSGQMLGSSSFSPSPFSPDMGNGTSIFDMRYRPGNDENWETTVQTSLIGIDIAEEGPVGKGSILANYRYSFVGILSAMGLDFGGESISFQDLSFNYTLPLEKGKFSFFGLGGLSKNDFSGSDDMLEWEFDKDSRDINYSGKTGAIGATWESGINQNAKLKISALLSSSDQQRDFREKDGSAAVSRNLGGEDYGLNRSILSTKVEWIQRMKRSILRIGVLNDFHNGFIDIVQYDETGETIKNSSANELSGVNFQPYIHWDLPVTDQLLLEAGLRYSYFSFTSSQSIEPRIRLTYDLSNKSYLSLSFTKNSMMQASKVYLVNPVNESLDFTLNYTGSLIVGFSPSQLTDAKLELYYQRMNQIPYLSFLGISTANFFDEEPGYIFENTGESQNYGLELTVERRLENGYYLLGGGSLYKSEFLYNDQWKDSRFDGNYTFNLTAGKEIRKIKGDKQKVMNMSSRFLYLGGFNIYPVNESLSNLAMTTVYEYSSLFSNSLEDYIRLDISFSWRFNKVSSSRIIGIDIQNVLNREHSFIDYYDVRKGEVVKKNQLGMIPVIYYKIEF